MKKFFNNQLTIKEIVEAREGAKARSYGLCSGCVLYNKCPILDAPITSPNISWLKDFNVKNCKRYIRR